MKKLNKFTRTVILLVICLLSVITITFSWLNRPGGYADGVYNELTLLVPNDTASNAKSAYVKHTDLTVSTYSGSIENGSFKDEGAAALSNGASVTVPAQSCMYFRTTLQNTNQTAPTRFSLKAPVISSDTLSVFAFAPISNTEDSLGGYIVKNIEVKAGSSVNIDWYFCNEDSTSTTVTINTLPTAEFY